MLQLAHIMLHMAHLNASCVCAGIRASSWATASPSAHTSWWPWPVRSPPPAAPRAEARGRAAVLPPPPNPVHAGAMHARATRARSLRAGYWAFGWAVAPFLVSSFSFPTGLIAAVYVLAIMQIVGNYQIYARPTFGAPRACPEPRLWDAAPARTSILKRHAVPVARRARRR